MITQRTAAVTTRRGVRCVCYNPLMDIADGIQIPDEELHFSYARSGGPGGQNVNKVASKAILHWSLDANTTLSPDVRDRLRRHHKNRLTNDGFLVLQSQKS